MVFTFLGHLSGVSGKGFTNGTDLNLFKPYRFLCILIVMRNREDWFKMSHTVKQCFKELFNKPLLLLNVNMQLCLANAQVGNGAIHASAGG